MSKKVVGLVLFAALVLIPLTSMSKDDKSDTIMLSVNNTLVIDEAMMPDSIAKVVAKAKTLDSQLSGISGKFHSKPLYLILNTPGGSIQSGLEMFDVLNSLGRPINTVTMFAASMGFQTVQNLGERLITKNGVLMSHRAAGGFQGSFGGTHPSQIDSRYALWLSRVDELDRQTVKRTNGKQTLESYQKQYANEMWLTGTQAVEQGYADKVVNVKCDKSLDGTHTQKSEVFGMTIEFDLDNCPLNTGPLNVRVNLDTNRGVIPIEQFVTRGGAFGPSCLASESKDKLCAKDTSLTIQKIAEIKTSFKDRYENKKNNIVDFL